MANYLIYPFEKMRITQTYLGTTSHKPHTIGNPKDYPLDEGGKDSGRDAFYCPCDELEVVKSYGVGFRGTNTFWVQSTSPVNCGDGTIDYICGQITHPNDSDFKNIKVGKKYKRKELICYEGTDGASGNHIHFSFGKGKIAGKGWKQNSRGKWVLTTTRGNGCKPEKLFFIDPNFTKIINSKGLNFKTLPKEEIKTETTKKNKYSIGNYKVTDANLLRVRSGPSTLYSYKKFNKLSSSAQTKIKKLNKNKPADGYVKNLTFTVVEVKGKWGKTGSGWVCLDYCSKI